MIKYSTNPAPDARAITNSPTAPIKTKGGHVEAADALDLDAEDANE
jgi:hypothetical protein